MIAKLARELRWAFRHARRRPVFAASVVATLALGIAATTVAYGFGAAILWRPLPFPDPDRLAFVWEAVARDGVTRPSRVTSFRFAQWRDRARSFESLALFATAGFSLEMGGSVVPVRGVRVSAGYFDTLGVRPMLGRTFTPGDELPGRAQVVVISHGFWRERLGGRPDAIGSTIRFNGAPYDLIGVMPALAFPGWPVNPATVTIDASTREFWVPIARTPQLDDNARSHVYGVLARLAPGTSITNASEELTRLTSTSDADPHGGVATPFRDQFAREARLPIVALLGAAGALLLVSCANLAALQMASFESRRAEIGIRAAIGASAQRLAAQLSIESMVLAGAAGAAGLAISRYALAVLPDRLPPGLPLLTSAALDWRVATVAIAASIAAGMLIAASPVLRLLRSGPAPRGVVREGRGGVFTGLVVAQVSVTIALVACAALLVQSLWRVQAVESGFLVDNVIVAEVGLPRTLDTPAKVSGAEDALRRTFERRVDVRGVALAYDHPLEANWTDAFLLDGRSSGDADVRGQAQLRIVSPSYFAALGVEVLSGRPFSEDDGLSRPGMAVVNESFAGLHGPVVIGRRLRSSSARATWGPAAADTFEIVGVVEDERFRGLERPSEPAVYLSTRQFPQTSFVLLLRTSSEPRSVLRDVRAGVRAVEPLATLNTPVTLADILAEQLVSRRVTTDVIGGFGAAALGLAVLGVYGVLAMAVASRTREIGVRLALGASPGRIAADVLRRSIATTAPGIALGVALALLAGRLLRGLLVGVTATDLRTLVVVAVTVLAAAAIAALVPAVRAARVDPVSVLRGL